jgi:D-amino-acid dehydrogenase
MRFLVSTNVEQFHSVSRDDVFSQIHVCAHKTELASQLRGPEQVDVWICEGDEVTTELLTLWTARNEGSPSTLLVNNAEFIPHIESISRGRLSAIQALPKQEESISRWVFAALRQGEMLHVHSCAATSTKKRFPVSVEGAQETVVLVGAGIMNLIAGEVLASQGFRVRLVDSGPDPRVCKEWSRFGVTHGGGDARMFTYTEADNYNETGSDIYHDMRQIFRKTTLQGGWSVKLPSEFSAAEQEWVETFERIPIWMAKGMKEDIFHVNRQAGELWAEYISSTPEIFTDVSLRHNILRFYAEHVAYTAARGLNSAIGALVKDLNYEETLQQHRGLSSAIENDHLAGALVVEGFTLRIHKFVQQLLQRITDLGGEFIWDCPVQAIQRNASGEVTSLKCESLDLHADHFVISTGVARNGLLNGTASENLIQGVLGVWLQIPNLGSELRHSIKIHRRGALVEDINVTVSSNRETGEEKLILGGGYGYVGQDIPSPDAPEMQALFDELEQVAKIYFPAAYAHAKERGTLWPGGERKYCIRPFTCTGLGVYEDIPTANGGHLIITGGNNTGGFAQAPVLARAVLRSIRGEHDPIHVLFHPSRSRLTARSLKQSTIKSRDLLEPMAQL